MNEIRSAHKAATRDGLAQIAAKLALAGQLNTKTLAATAGVSLRTLHNYFSHLSAAIEHYEKYCVANFLAQLHAGASLVEAVVATSNVVELHYLGQGLLQAQLRQPVANFLCQQQTLSVLESHIIAAATGAAIQVVLENCGDEPSAELIHAAFSTLNR